MRSPGWYRLALALVAAGGCGGSKNDPVQGEVKMTTDDEVDPGVRQRIEGAVTEYVAREQRWAREQYQIEPRRRTPDGATIVVDVVHRDDSVPGPRGGGGKSFQLHLNATTFAVEKVLHFQ
jgi:hypothetical protein